MCFLPPDQKTSERPNEEQNPVRNKTQSRRKERKLQSPRTRACVTGQQAIFSDDKLGAESFRDPTILHYQVSRKWRYLSPWEMVKLLQTSFLAHWLTIQSCIGFPLSSEFPRVSALCLANGSLLLQRPLTDKTAKKLRELAGCGCNFIAFL